MSERRSDTNPPVEALFRLPKKRQFRIREAAEIIGMSQDFVENQFDEGEIPGHVHSGGAGLRKSKTIPAEWLMAYLIKTARYDSPMRIEMAKTILDTFTAQDLGVLVIHINDRLRSPETGPSLKHFRPGSNEGRPQNGR